MTLRLSIIGLFALTLGLGCSSSTTDPGMDGSTPLDLGAGHDGGMTGPDTGIITFDAGPDTGMTAVDSGPRPDGAPAADLGPMPTIMGSVGSACTMDSDCNMLTGGTCETNLGGFFTFPGGYCTEMCGGSGGGMCPSGSMCFAFGAMGMCAKTCSTDADCRASEGYTCAMPPIIGGGPYCLPPMGMMGMRDGGMPFP